MRLNRYAKNTKMPEIIINIKNCQECPFFKEERMYTADSFEMAFDWFCKKKNNKKIAGYVESGGDKIKIPDWCPVAVKKTKNK